MSRLSRQCGITAWYRDSFEYIYIYIYIVIFTWEHFQNIIYIYVILSSGFIGHIFTGHFTTLLGARIMESNGKKTDEWSIKKDLKGSGRGLFEVLSLDFPEVIAEKLKRLSATNIPAETPNDKPPN
jgi:hypothetical protein